MEENAEFIAQFIMLVYLVITLIICLVFDYEPIKAAFWILFPVIFIMTWISTAIKQLKE